MNDIFPDAKPTEYHQLLIQTKFEIKTSYEALTLKRDDHLMNFSHHKESDVLGQNEEKKRYDMQLPFQLSYLKMSVF